MERLQLGSLELSRVEAPDGASGVQRPHYQRVGDQGGDGWVASGVGRQSTPPCTVPPSRAVALYLERS